MSKYQQNFFEKINYKSKNQNKALQHSDIRFGASVRQFYKTLSTILLLTFGHHITAQVGVNVGFSTFNQSQFNDHFDQSFDQNQNGMTISLDYWFRLKQKRLEFLPTLFYSVYKDYEMSSYGFQFRSTIYPFDFQGDCNCPTFSKENELLKKGFFIRLAPGIGNWSASSNQLEGFENVSNLSAWLPEIGGAVGLDIGITNLLTVSPEVKLRYVFGGNWEGAMFNIQSLRILEPSIRIGLRFDEKNYGFKQRRRR